MSEYPEPIRYSMVIEWEPLDRIFVVTVPELPGCRTHGRTYEEAVAQGQDAIESWIDAKRHWGRDIPPPRYYDLGEEPSTEPEPAASVPAFSDVSHTVWVHERYPQVIVTLAGNDEDDAKRYQERDLREALAKVKALEAAE